MVSIVNGYVCFNCTDTEKAQKGADPANPTGEPWKDKNPAKVLKDKEARDVREGKTSSDPSKAGDAAKGASLSDAVKALLPAGLGTLVDVTA